MMIPRMGQQHMNRPMAPRPSQPMTGIPRGGPSPGEVHTLPQIFNHVDPSLSAASLAGIAAGPNWLHHGPIDPSAYGVAQAVQHLAPPQMQRPPNQMANQLTAQQGDYGGSGMSADMPPARGPASPHIMNDPSSGFLSGRGMFGGVPTMMNGRTVYAL